MGTIFFIVLLVLICFGLASFSLFKDRRDVTINLAPPIEVSTEQKHNPAVPTVKNEVVGYPLHTNITATVFWVGESENNKLSAWDDLWQKHYGGYDNPSIRNGYHPKNFTPKENPFYFSLPYNDFDFDTIDWRRVDAYTVVPWAKEKNWGDQATMLKNRWIQITHEGAVCYGQWEDSGPYVYDDARYVFGKNDERPANKESNNAGIGVSPALRDCLGFFGTDNDMNAVAWRFIEFENVPDGPWKEIITTSQTYWE